MANAIAECASDKTYEKALATWLVVLPFLSEPKREAGWVSVDDMDVEVAIAEAIAVMEPKTDYCETGIPVLKYLKQHGWAVMQSKKDADAITKALNSIEDGA